MSTVQTEQGQGTTPQINDPELEARAAVLNTEGTSVRGLAKRMGQGAAKLNDLAQEIARSILTVRATIRREVTVKTEGQPDQRFAVRALDGKGAEYQDWYRKNVRAILEEHAPVEYVEVPGETDENGQPRMSPVSGANWVASCERSIQHYVASFMPQFVAEHGYEQDADILGLKLITPADRKRNRANGGGGDGGTTPAKRMENLFGGLLKASKHEVEGQDEPVEYVDPPAVVESVNLLVIGCEKFRDSLTSNTVAAMPKNQRKQLGAQLARAQSALDNAVNLLDLD